MRILVISDVHANLSALDAVFADAGDFDMLWSLGDIVGYGPDPNACIARLEEYAHLAIAGNHDWGVLGKLDLENFNADARRANLWTRDQLSAASRAYLEAVPETRVQEGVTCAHGSPRHPIWEYLIYAGVAKQNLAFFDTGLCLVGHTHVPVIFREEPENGLCQALAPEENRPFPIDGHRLIVNPGSVGQPRDGDSRAAYLVLDTELRTFEHRRVAYDIAATQKKMRAAGLPPRSITRLDLGW